MNKKPLVSVIIPTYNRSLDLERAINSVLIQTYKNIEVLVVDDNNATSIARKDVENIMCEYKDDVRVKYFQHSQNLNGAAARNTGIKQSAGDIICFLDDDDFYYPNKIERQLNYLLNNKEFSGVYCGTKAKGKIIIPTLEGDLTKHLLLMKTSIFTPTLMIYKNSIIALGGFNEKFVRHQDYEFLIRFFYKNKIGVVEECLLELGDNDGENILKGRKLNKLKNTFLRTFNTEITRFGRSFKREVYSKHYSLLFLSHVKNSFFFLAVHAFVIGLSYSPFNFLKSLVGRVKDHISYKKHLMKRK